VAPGVEYRFRAQAGVSTTEAMTLAIDELQQTGRLPVGLLF